MAMEISVSGIDDNIAKINTSEEKIKKTIQIQVSRIKKSFFFYLNLAKKYIKHGNDVELCALGKVKRNAKRIMMWLVAVLLSVAVSTAVDGCKEELTSFSACLPYVSYPPNNLTESASENCCTAFSSAMESMCLCYLLRDPLILGFPLNSSRLLSLPSLCPSSNATSASFPFLCSSASSPALPPLNTAPTQPLRTGRSSGPGFGGSSGKRVPAAGAGAATHVMYRDTSNASTLTSHILFFITLIFSWHRYIVQP